MGKAVAEIAERTARCEVGLVLPQLCALQAARPGELQPGPADRVLVRNTRERGELAAEISETQLRVGLPQPVGAGVGVIPGAPAQIARPLVRDDVWLGRPGRRTVARWRSLNELTRHLSFLRAAL
jgi:hypothetical protein